MNSALKQTLGSQSGERTCEGPGEIASIIERLQGLTADMEGAVEAHERLANKIFGPLPCCNEIGSDTTFEPNTIAHIHHMIDRAYGLLREENEHFSRLKAL